MMPRRRLLLRVCTALAVVATISLSGCVSCAGPPVTARGTSGAPSVVGDGPHHLAVSVLSATDGQPIPGAAVVAYWDGTTLEQAREAGEGQDPGQAIPGEFYPTVDTRHTLRANTDADGLVAMRVPEGIVVGLVAAADGFTEEWLPGVPSSGPSSMQIITVYESRMEVTINGTWGPGAGSSGFVTGSNYAWDDRELDVGTDPAARAGYAARIQSASITLAWENGITGGGDLGIGLGPNGGAPTYFDDASENLGIGTQTEETSLARGDIQEHGLDTGTLHVGPATKSGFLAPGGLAYSLVLVLEFEGLSPDIGCASRGTTTDDSSGFGVDAPGIGVAAILAALAAIGLILARRR